jgi:hypothetical protein
MTRRVDERKMEDETLKLLRRTEAIQNSQDFKAPSGGSGYGFGPKAATAPVRQSADDLQRVLMEWLENASAGPSFWERFATIGAPVAGIYGAMGAPGMRR